MCRPIDQDAKRPGDMEDEELYKDFVVGGPQDALTREVATKAPKECSASPHTPPTLSHARPFTLSTIVHAAAVVCPAHCQDRRILYVWGTKSVGKTLTQRYWEERVGLVP